MSKATAFENKGRGVRKGRLLEPEYITNAHRLGIVTFAVIIIGWLGIMAAVGAGNVQSWGAITLWGLAAFAGCSIVGFLFGVPRVDQGKDAPPTNGAIASNAQVPPSVSNLPADDDDLSQSAQRIQAIDAFSTNLYHFVTNDAVQQVSDWLTKIIVGLGLVELRNTPALAERLGQLIAHSTGMHGTFFNAHSSIGIAACIYFGSAGFLTTYLIMRLCVQVLIARVEAGLTSPQGIGAVLRELAREADQQNKDNSRASDAAKNIGEGALAQNKPQPPSNVLQSILPLAASIGAQAVLPAVLSVVRSKAADVRSDDPNRGRFGGSPAQSGKRLTATVERAPGTRDLFKVTMVVAATNNLPLGKVVTFYLHPTFRPDVVQQHVGDDGRATLTVVAWGAFTVGVETEDRTRLELDLAALADAPMEFRTK